MKKRDTIYPYMTTSDEYSKCSIKNNSFGKKSKKCKNNNVFFKLNFFQF